MQEQGFKGTFSPIQTKQLLQPINPRRVLTANGQSHVSQQDVTAHLIRVFGFGNFATELINLELVFETCRDPENVNVHKQKWDVAYRAIMRLTIFDEKHNVVTTYEDGSMGDAQNQVRWDAHDLAMKTAISTAKKRCCINLGDQFGLSLYNKGQIDALVIATHVMPKGDVAADAGDVTKDVAQQESLGVDEIERPQVGGEADAEAEARIKESLGGKQVEE